MAPLTVKGIDEDGNSCTLSVPAAAAVPVARELLDGGWRYALLLRDGQPVGGIGICAALRCRTWWGEPLA
jgi:hypothetical protein